MIIFNTYQLIFESIKNKTNVIIGSDYPEHKVTSLNCWPKTKDGKKQEIFSFKMLERDNIWHFCFAIWHYVFLSVWSPEYEKHYVFVSFELAFYIYRGGRLSSKEYNMSLQ